MVSIILYGVHTLGVSIYRSAPVMYAFQVFLDLYDTLGQGCLFGLVGCHLDSFYVYDLGL